MTMTPNASMPTVSPNLASDARSLDALKRTARDTPEAAVRQAARQFEALFMNMLLKSMREALPKEGMLDSSASRMATGMLDEQWAQNLSGKGLGLADMMIRQLSKNQATRDGDGLLMKLDVVNRAAGAAAAPGPGAMNMPVLRPPAQSTLPTSPASPAMGKPVGEANPGTPQDFVRRMRDHAVEAEKTSGIPAHFILGQAALESGWGRHEIPSKQGVATHNLFGIKAGRNWQGATVDAVTTEYVNGVPRRTVEKFRAYGSYAEAFTDYARLLSGNARYAAVVKEKSDAAVFAGRMQAAGYATDPAYARKLTQVINQTLALQAMA